MVVTKEPQLIDPILRISEVVYMSARNQLIDKERETVTFEIHMFCIKNVLRKEKVTSFDEDGNLIRNEDFTPKLTEIEFSEPKLALFSKRNAEIKLSTFNKLFSNLKDDQWDDVLLRQIDYLNSLEWKNKSTPPPYYWNLKSKDMKVLSDSQMLEILKPIKIK